MDGAYDSPGALPGFGEPSRGNAECELEVDAPPSAGVRDPRSMTPAVVGAHARTQRGGPSADRAGFKTASCESSVTE